MDNWQVGNWDVEIINRPADLFKEVWVFRYLPNGKVEVLMPDLQTTITYEGGTIKTDDRKPTMLILGSILDRLAITLQGRVPTEGKFTEGELVATKSHLQDLRHLLKLPTKV